MPDSLATIISCRSNSQKMINSYHVERRISISGELNKLSISLILSTSVKPRWFSITMQGILYSQFSTLSIVCRILVLINKTPFLISLWEVEMEISTKYSTIIDSWLLYINATTNRLLHYRFPLAIVLQVVLISFWEFGLETFLSLYCKLNMKGYCLLWMLAWISCK